MNTTITFIHYSNDYPSFSVDFRNFVSSNKKQQKNSTIEKVSSIAIATIRLFKNIFIAFSQASYLTISNMGVSFKYTVLGYYGNWSNFNPSADIYLAVFRIALWALGMAACTATTTARILYEKTFPISTSSLMKYSGTEIDATHIVSKELSMDTSRVPADVKVANLMQLFNDINFDLVDNPGYMAPASRKEGSSVYTKEQLKESLATFIKYVETRQAFLGTPPAYDVPRLMSFYQQIEDAVRLSIFKVTQELNEFIEKNGADLDCYTPQQLNEYSNLLENKARVAIDLAIAGKHCGARYMGEAMDIYYTHCSGDLASEKNFGECLIEILANKRNEIASEQIQRHLGNGTHEFAKYMSSLGPILGIPGSKNIVEHLSSELDRDMLLREFFNEYTVNAIIDAIQTAVKKSGSLREKLTDWLKEQLGEWKKVEIEERISDSSLEIKKLIQEEILQSEMKKEIEHITILQDLLQYLKRNDCVIQLNTNQNMNLFLTELFATDKAKEYFTKVQNLTPINSVQLRESIKTTCSQIIIQEEL